MTNVSQFSWPNMAEVAQLSAHTAVEQFDRARAGFERRNQSSRKPLPNYPESQMVQGLENLAGSQSSMAESMREVMKALDGIHNNLGQLSQDVAQITQQTKKNVPLGPG
jgi:hypothetical protein